MNQDARGRRILLVDDDQRLADMVARFLRQSGLVVQHRVDAHAARIALSSEVPDLLVLDLMLPDADGLDLCREIRASGGAASLVPILMLTARGDLTDRVVGLELGADDYLAKPFEPRELLARVRALLRRAQLSAAMPPVAASLAAHESGQGMPPGAASGLAPALGADAIEHLKIGALEIDRAARQVRVDGETRSMTSHQFDLLWVLARHAGRVMSRDQLMDQLRGHPLDAFDRSIDVHVGKIRQAIEDDPRNPQRLLTVRGAGYVLARKPEQPEEHRQEPSPEPPQQPPQQRQQDGAS